MTCLHFLSVKMAKVASLVTKLENLYSLSDTVNCDKPSFSTNQNGQFFNLPPEIINTKLSDLYVYTLYM